MLRHRLLSGFIIGPLLVLAAQHLPKPLIFVLLASISAVTQAEVYRLFRGAGRPVVAWAGILSGVILLAATVFSVGPALRDVAFSYALEHTVLVGVFIFIALLHLAPRRADMAAVSIAMTFLGILYVPYLFSYFGRLAFTWDNSASGISVTGRALIYYALIVIKSGDTGAYVFGSRFGTRKMAPRISPGKTWEGFAGGVTMAVLASLLFFAVCRGRLGTLSMSIVDAVILGILLSLAGVLGDLFESLIKREAGIKDSSAIVPGMGGLLDVLDSLLLGVPVLFLYACVFFERAS